MQKLRFPTVKNLELSKVLSFKPGVGQSIAQLAGTSPFSISTFPVHSSSFFKSSFQFSIALGMANAGAHVGPRNKMNTLLIVKSD